VAACACSRGTATRLAGASRDASDFATRGVDCACPAPALTGCAVRGTATRGVPEPDVLSVDEPVGNAAAVPLVEDG
jgi:hypothetical protein